MNDALAFTKALLTGKADEVAIPEPFEPASKDKTPESANQHAIISYLEVLMNSNQLFFARINNTGVYDAAMGGYRSLSRGMIKGFPDIFVMMKGRCIFLEVKSSIGKQSIDQAKVQRFLEAQGAEYYIVRSVNYVRKALSYSSTEPHNKLPY